jgi:hypothetical protein
MIGGIAGMAGGFPIGGGLLADQISAALGRPLQINLGPSVFEDPATGQVTTTGGSMTVENDHFEGGNDKDREFIGVPPDLGLGGQAPAPSSETYYGKDPAAPKSTPTAPIDTPLPEGLSPTEAPSGVGVNVGNTGWSPEDLADIFRQWGTRIYGQQNRESAL